MSNIPEELRELSLQAGVKIIACQMTVDLFGYDMDDFVPEVADWVGAASLSADCTAG